MAEHIEGWPYVVMWGNYEAARFPADEWGKENAKTYAKESVGSVIDTTPVPRIPEDAKFIHWVDEGGAPYYARRDGDLWETDLGSFITQEDLLGDDWAKNAEIIVLDKR